MRRVVVACLSCVTFCISVARANAEDLSSRWSLAQHGGIVWKVNPSDTHRDNVEMDGLQVAEIVTYEMDQGSPRISSQVIWPMLRFHPNETFDHFSAMFEANSHPEVTINGTPVDWRAEEVYQKGILRLSGRLSNEAGATLAFERTMFPSVNKPIVFDVTEVSNRSSAPVVLGVEEAEYRVRSAAVRGIYGAYEASSHVQGVGEHQLAPGETFRYTVTFEGRRVNGALPDVDPALEEQARQSRIESLLSPLRLETPNAMLNTAFGLAKIRAGESIYRTKGGLFHSPGGGVYYAAIWANDQVEYAAPFFGILGDPTAAEATINALRHFARFMNPQYHPLPSSIIAEGDGFWNGAGDRGDMAMIAYGAGRYALARGQRGEAEELWPLIAWSLEYLRREVTGDGVVASDSDELEGRFPAGKANLCTSALYYDALLSAAMLGRSLGKPGAQLRDYRNRAVAVRKAIAVYFGANVEGFETYRYYNKADMATNVDPGFAAYASRPDPLRAWIAIPLAVGIDDRKSGTIDALFSSRLWTEDGLATESGQRTFWDRSTLYALRGVLAVGDTQRGMEHLIDYSKRRLLGEHVPYSIEAYPEGNQRQLSAESALYCRVFTEGLFGIRPTGLRSFTLTPHLPEDWPAMALRNVHAFGHEFDLEVTRTGGDTLRVAVVSRGHHREFVARPGEAIPLNLG